MFYKRPKKEKSKPEKESEKLKLLYKGKTIIPDIYRSNLPEFLKNVAKRKK